MGGGLNKNYQLLCYNSQGVVSSVVEHLSYKQKVTGSSPVLLTIMYTQGLSSKGLGQRPSKSLM